jgi:hypothetical protein
MYFAGVRTSLQELRKDSARQSIGPMVLLAKGMTDQHEAWDEY